MDSMKKLTLPLSLSLLLSSIALSPAPLAAEELPRLHPRARTAVELSFEEPTSVLGIYRDLAEAAGLTVVFDPKFRDQDLRIAFPGISTEEALAVLGRAAGTFHKVLNENTILVAADTPQNRRNYEELVIRTFSLENADVKTMMTALRSLVDAKKISADLEHRTITVRDTAAKMAVTSRLVDVLDRHPAETQIEVAVLAVPPTLLKGLKSESEGVRLSAEDLAGLRAAGDVTVLAEPSVSILADGQASLALTDAVPFRIPEADRTEDKPQGYQYVDVGLNLRMEAQVHAENREVSLEARLNMDSLVPATGDGLPIRRSRHFESTLRLKEGQSYLITGLLEASPGSPGLFGAEGTKKGQQVVVALTPRIVREPGLTQADLENLWVGTESRINYQGSSDSDALRSSEEPRDREEVRRRLRERLAKLPRGLQASEGEEAPEAETGEGMPPRPVIETEPPR